MLKLLKIAQMFTHRAANATQHSGAITSNITFTIPLYCTKKQHYHTVKLCYLLGREGGYPTSHRLAPQLHLLLNALACALTAADYELRGLRGLLTGADSGDRRRGSSYKTAR